MARIAGVEVRSRIERQVEFVCPRCGLDRVGAVISPQRWCVVLGLPVVPLATLDRAVVCGTCDHSTDLEVLAIPTTTQLAVYVDQAVRHAVVSIVRAGHGTPDPATLRHALGAVSASTPEYDARALDADLVTLDQNELTAALRRLRPELTSHGKQALLHRMASLAQVDGPITDRERCALVHIGVEVGMPAAHINGVLTVATMALEAA